MRRFPALVGLALALAAPAVHAANVRQDRPRILLGNGTSRGITPDTFKTRCTTDAAYKQRCQASLGSGAGSWPAITFAAQTIVTGDPSGCQSALAALNDPSVSGVQDPPADGDPTCDAHCNISRNGRSMEQLAVVRDWCDGALSAANKSALDQRIATWADWYLTHYLAPDVFHDDMANVWNTIALAGLTLKGTTQDAKADMLLSQADTQWKTVILPAEAYVGDWWHEGMTYAVGVLGSTGWYATSWSIATDDDIYAWSKQHAGNVLEGYFDFYAYALRPDDNFVYFGDTTSNKQNVQLFHRSVVDILNYGAKSPLGQGLSMYIRDHSMPFYDYSGADGLFIALLYDASAEPGATALSSLPTARWLSQEANDVAVMRSGWDKDATYVWVSCGDYLGPHQHDEAGAFQIFKHAMLSGSDGAYDAFDSDHWANYYSQHSVHANTLAVYAPGEVFPTSKTLGGGPNVNDGGQRTLRRNKDGTGYPSTDLATYQANKTSGPFYETGDLKTFEHATCHDYVACDVTAAYDSSVATTNGNPAKVDEVTRQFVYLPPDILVVFDRVEATDPSYEKRFLLHALAAPTTDATSVTIQNGAGELVAKTLLPKSPTLTVHTNFEVEGTPHPPSAPDTESGGTRVEVSPGTPAKRDYFLHVLKATDPGGAAPTTSLTETASSAQVTIDDGGAHYVLTLEKSGKMAGHLTAKLADGTKCDDDLGAHASGSGGGPGAGGSSQHGPGSGSAAGGGGAGGANGDGGGKGGCGCRAVSSDRESGAWAIAALSLGFAFSRRRRRARRAAS